MLSSDQIKIERIVKNSASSFYWGMKSLSKEKKRAMFSIYAFCRIVDDIADNFGHPEKKNKKLDEWVKKINILFSKKNHKTSILRELKISINNFNLDQKDFISIIEGMKMDVKENIKFPSQNKLKKYCERVAVAVGYLSIKIFGIDEKLGRKYAYNLGMAFQLTNIVRDFSEDLKLGRCYISDEKLKKYRIKKDIELLQENSKIQNVLQDILQEAKFFFDESDKLSKKIDKKKIIASEVMKHFYKKIHKKMFGKHLNLEKKVKLGLFDKFSIFFHFMSR